MLNSDVIKKIVWKKLTYSEPSYFFVPKDFSAEKDYALGFKLDELMHLNSNGVETQKDEVNIFFTDKEKKQVLNDFINLSEIDIKKKYDLTEGRDWKIKTAKEDLIKNNILIHQIQYRPFDYRYTNYTGKTKGIMAYPRFEVFQNFINNNIALCMMRQYASDDFSFCLISKTIIENQIFHSNRGKVNSFPLYLYPENNAQQTLDGNQERTPNLNKEIVNKIASGLGLTFVPEQSDPHSSP